MFNALESFLIVLTALVTVPMLFAVGWNEVLARRYRWSKLPRLRVPRLRRPSTSPLLHSTVVRLPQG